MPICGDHRSGAFRGTISREIREMKLPRWMNGYFWLSVLIIALVTVPQLKRSVAAGSGLPMDWAASAKWLESAECARTMGVLLVGCPNGRLVPLAAISNADDPGHALLLGAYSMITKKKLKPKSISVLNTIVNFLGLFLTAGLLFSLGARVSPLIILSVGAVMANDLHAIAPHPAELGAGSFAAVLPIVILAAPALRARRWLLPAWLVVGLLALALASLLRESIGLMGLAASAGAMAVSVWFSPKRLASAVYHAALFAGIILVAYTPAGIFKARDLLYDVPQTALIERHGAAHSLYLGLGVVPNAFGIRWSDEAGSQAVKQVDSKVAYVSQDYYRILGHQYLRLVMSNPVEVIRIYFAKLMIFLRAPLGGAVWATSSVGFVGLVIASILATVRLRLWRARLWQGYPIDAVTAVACVFVGFHLVQAAVIHPSVHYALPIKIYFLLLVCSCIEYCSFLESSPDLERSPDKG